MPCIFACRGSIPTLLQATLQQEKISRAGRFTVCSVGTGLSVVFGVGVGRIAGSDGNGDDDTDGVAM